MKKLLILGRGQVGSALVQSLHNFDVHSWPHDIDDLTSEVIETIAPDAIINAAGRTDLAWCEANAREAVRSNLEAPVRLYQRVLEVSLVRGRPGDGALPSEGIRFIHFSSGCVWDGPYNQSGNPFAPSDPPTPACLYSWTKAAADAMLLAINPNRIAILRPRQVYSTVTSHAQGKVRNTLLKLMNYPKLIDTPNSVSSMEVIEKTLQYVLREKEDWSGIWNVYDRGVTSPFEIGELLWRAGLRDRPERLSKEALDVFLTPKRVDTVLRDTRFESAIQPESVQTVLARTIEKLRSQRSLDNAAASPATKDSVSATL